MKALVVLLTLLAAVWLIKRSLKRRQDEAAAPKRGAIPQQLPMLACTHCGMHVPAHEMVKGMRGHYFCSLAHQQAHEGLGHGQSR